MKLKAVLTVSAFYLGCCSTGCIPGTDRRSPDFRRSHARDCSVELDGSECGALYGTYRHCSWECRWVWLRHFNGRMGSISGGARPVAKLFLVIHLLMTVGF